MAVQGADVLVVGAGVVGRSLAFALAVTEPSVRVALAGDTGGAATSNAAASRAAGAMLGVLGEVTECGLRTRHGRLRTDLAVEAAGLWPSWRAQVRTAAGAAAPGRDGYGTGTFMILNAVSSALDDASFTAVAQAAAEYGLGCEETAPAGIPGYRPLDNDRALRAWYLPAEGFLDARAWLATLDTALAALPNTIRTPAGTLTAAPEGGYLLDTPAGFFRAPRAVVAAGAWTTPILEALDPDLPVVPVLAAAGTAVTVTGPETRPAVIRTPNRAYACGLHAVPQADGSLYLGASAHPALTPTPRPTAGALRFLLDAALSQLDHRLAGAGITHTHHGNRPLSLDGHPVIGPTLREGLWVASGTHRDGLHASPLIAAALADALLAPTPTNDPLPGVLAAFNPGRELIADLTVKEAAAEAAAHHAALAAEARMRPPLTGAWPQALADGYADLLDRAYAAMPEGYIPPPDLAPLAYESTGPALAEIAAAHLARHDRAHA
ncbi:FAD-binding oxidoreductase [Streptomyces sp. NBC_01551]|uniref:NAD(P)/FAD-dependent oxidoreductase n=1 Tax=Streptomyces sp. NBC_01551 TaxID=2975876 RepID=UPI002252BD59|nr:FAD-dependent oxidoreductase [Streptomyces sp. NBC_01551]MCX4529506.1 FAD-binding oxidoreductase [Streptomyces sp. NBC_01551]